MHDVGAPAHETGNETGNETAHETAHETGAAQSDAGRPVALIALEPQERCRGLETVLAAAGLEVRHAPSVADALQVPVPGPDALVLLGGAARPDDSTSATVAALRRAGWEHVVVVGADPGTSVISRALGVGARGFLIAAPERIPPSAVRDGAPPGRSQRPSPVSDVGGRERSLSAREVQVLALAADGLSNPEIAQALGLSALTVKSHLSRMTRRLGAHDRAHLVLLALRAGAIA